MALNKRINIVLPETTIRAMSRIARPGERSRFIDQAVRHFVAHSSSEAIRMQLEKAAIRDRDLDREIGNDWQAVDNEAWQRPDMRNPKDRMARGAAKSTSQILTRR
jgi:hypothetical protein